MNDPATELIDHLATTPDIVLATTLREGGEVRTPAWAVVVDGQGSIRNGFGDASRWYRRARRTDRVVAQRGAARPACRRPRPGPG